MTSLEKGRQAREFTPEQTMLRDAAATFVARNSTPGRVRELRATRPGFSREVWLSMAKLGWTGMVYPSKHGGGGMRFADLQVVVEEIGRGLLTEPFTACAVLAGRTLLYGGNAELARRLLPGLIDGSRMISLAWQEDIAGIDPDDVDTQALQRSDGSWVLNGEKRFVVAPEGIDGLIVSARAGKKLALFHLPMNSTGVESTLERRADGSYSGRIALKSVAVPADGLIATGVVARRALARAMDEAAVMAAVELYGLMSRALEISLDFMNTRAQFGRKIGSYQALQHRAVDLYMQKAMCMGAIDDAIRALDDGSDAKARAAAVSRAKSRASDAAIAITRESIRFHGAMGIVDECDIGLYLQRALVLAAWLGNGAEHRRRYARAAPFHVEDEEATSASVPASTEELPAGTDWNALDDETFRTQVRLFFERNYPEHLRYLLRRARWSEIRDWVMKLARKGWIAPPWPREYGGMGLSPAKQIIYIEEREHWGVSRAPDQGVVYIGPVLMRYGTPEQKRKWLPKVVSGEHVWCQGYSEPNAGSDLASLTTEAVLDGDEWVINGRKIWTSLAHDATHMFLLARTDKTAKRQAGISFFLLDMKTPGITVRPIPNIEGYSEFCEETFDNVRIPKENLVGEMNQGWTIAKTLLTFERLHNGGPRRALYTLNKIPIVAREAGVWEDTEFQSKFTRLRLDVEELVTAYKRYADIISLGEAPDPSISMLKLWASETTNRLSELLIETAGNAGGIRDGELAFGGMKIEMLQTFYASLHAMIGAGANDIHRNVMAKRVLDLPSQ